MGAWGHLVTDCLCAKLEALKLVRQKKLSKQILILLLVSLSFYCFDETPLPKAAWGGNSIFGLYIQIHGEDSRQDLKLGSNLETGANIQAMEECFLLPCSLCLAQCALLLSILGVRPSHISRFLSKCTPGLPTAQSFLIWNFLL